MSSPRTPKKTSKDVKVQHRVDMPFMDEKSAPMVTTPKKSPLKSPKRPGSKKEVSTSEITPTRGVSSLALSEKARSVTPKKLRCAFGNVIQCNAKVEKAYSLIQKHTGTIGGNGCTGAIYGELTMGSMQKVLNLMMEQCELDSSSRFIDVGAGLGKPNHHAAQSPAVRLSFGVELEEVRWKLSMLCLSKILPFMSNDVPASGPEVDEDEEDGDAEQIHGGVNFVCGDIDDASTLDPFTHIYMYDLGFPPPLQQSIARKFNESVHAMYLVSYRPPRRILEEYGYKVEYITKMATSMTGSGESHTAYFYKRSNRPGVHELKGPAPAGCVKVTIPPRSGFAEKAVTVACAACYEKAVRAAVGDSGALLREAAVTVQSHFDEGRPSRDRKVPSRLTSP